MVVLSDKQKETLEHWFMLDASLGDSFRDEIQNINTRLDVQHTQYAPFGPGFPMMLLELCFRDWPREVFGDLFIGD